MAELIARGRKLWTLAGFTPLSHNQGLLYINFNIYVAAIHSRIYCLCNDRIVITKKKIIIRLMQLFRLKMWWFALRGSPMHSGEGWCVVALGSHTVGT